MPDFSVRQYGTDSSGRPVFMTRFMADWLAGVNAALGFTLTVTQGAFMVRAGGGADASAGYHDQAGCLDFRVWDLTEDQRERLIRTARRHGAAAWTRDQRHGMDPHIHMVLGTDRPLASGAAVQWRQYIAGHDGLASNGPDYEWRPSPLVLTPPEDDMPFTEAELRAIVREEVAAELDRSIDTKKGKRSMRQMVRELFQR